MKINKLKAFTLIELLVTIVISSIVISISLFVYLNLKKVLLNNILEMNTINESVLFIQELKDDFENAESIRSNGNILFFQSSVMGNIKYFIEDSLIYKPSGTSPGNYEGHTDNIEINTDFDNGLVTNISFDMITPQTKVIHVSLRKNYSYATLLNFKNHSVEY